MIPLTLDEIIRVIEGRTKEKPAPVTVTGVSTDSRTAGAGDLFFALRGERFDGHRFMAEAVERGAIAAVVQDLEAHSLGDRTILVRDSVAALGKLAAFHRRQRSMTVIAVTGSNGKTTTKCMIEHVLSQHVKGRGSPKSYNNAIGVPLSLLAVEAQDEFVVLEIGSNAPGEVEALAAMVSPNIGVITSIGAAHLEGLNSLKGVAYEKFSMLNHLRPGGIAVINADCRALGESIQPPGQVDRYGAVTFGESSDADVRISQFDGDLDGSRFRINDRHDVRLRVPGRHNAVNAAAAFAVCRRMKLDPERIVEALATVTLPPMRLNVWRGECLTIIDDSYNANPASAAVALEVLQNGAQGRRVYVVGDMLELGNDASKFHQELGRQIASAGIEVLVAVGEYRDVLIEGARSASRSPETISYENTQAAILDLPDRLHELDTVLIKGSRRVGLDQLVRRLRQRFEHQPDDHEIACDSGSQQRVG